MNDIRRDLENAIAKISADDLRNSSTHFLNTLGLDSDKTARLPEDDLDGFVNTLNELSPLGHLDKDKALVESDWQAANLLFQITDDELQNQSEMFNPLLSSEKQSYLFFTIALKKDYYARGKLAGIARQVNRLFPMPVMVLFVYGDRLSIAIFGRRKHKLDQDKDVLGKVSLIYGIKRSDPHRGHLDLLQELATTTRQATTFDDLQDRWSKVLDIELLNKDFYNSLSNWFFHAIQHVHIPRSDLLPDESVDAFKQTATIRLVTRIIFLWFAKEKEGLIPPRLFDRDEAARLLVDFDPNSMESGSYYQAILQNLFFPTLSVKQKERQFRTDVRGNKGYNPHFKDPSKYRYHEHFIDSHHALEDLFSTIPFLNGGLFECLDQWPDSENYVRIDGFSDSSPHQLWFPNALFFGEETTANISEFFEGDKKKTSVPVKGLFHILGDFKFTVEENTPIEIEIALDPELLGRIFENLLAQYNPETQKSARKETGSFYTPREIVNYMIDISLKAYLKDRLIERHGELSETDIDTLLDDLVSFESEVPGIPEALARTLSNALYDLKVIDPACGSGAFPIGLLQKLVMILNRLDRDHDRWKQRVLKRTHPSMLAKTQTMLEDRESDYLWKANLIQSSIFGVDIQPIAVQIAKLRCFITLLVDFRVVPEEDNKGVPALPNLDFKFVAANTLLSIPGASTDQDQFALDDPFVEQLSQATERFFYLSDLGEKKHVRQEIRRLINQEIKSKKKQLSDSQRRATGPKKTTTSRWEREIEMLESYQNIFVSEDKHVEFFDTRYFFPEVGEGFDIAIGNPPYIQLQSLPSNVKDDYKQEKYASYAAMGDIYTLFFEKGIRILKPKGYLSYISSNKWMRANYGEAFRRYLAEDVNALRMLDFGMAQNFSEATTYTCVMLLERSNPINGMRGCYITEDTKAMADLAGYFDAESVPIDDLSPAPWVILSSERTNIKQHVEDQGVPLMDKRWGIEINYGIKTGLNDAFYIDTATRNAMLAEEPQAKDIIVPLLRGRFVDRYTTKWDETWMIGTFPALDLNINDHPVTKSYLERYRKRLEPKPRGFKGAKWVGRKAGSYEWFETQDSISYYKEFSKPKIIYPNMTKYLPFYYDRDGYFFCNQKAFIITAATQSLGYLTALLNSSLYRCCFKDNYPELLGNTYELSKVFFDKVPLKLPPDEETVDLFETLVDFVQFAKHPGTDATLWTHAPGAVATFLEEVIDGCVMELYFAEHLAEKDLAIMDLVQSAISPAPDYVDSTAKRHRIEKFFTETSRPGHAIRDRISRFEFDSPDILGVILQEGDVDGGSGQRRLLNLIRSAMSSRKLYIHFDEVLNLVRERELELEYSTTKVYLSQLQKDEEIYDAGKGWYTILSESLTLDPQPVQDLVYTLKQAFPNLEFDCWSTEQLNRFSHHVLTRFVSFVYTDGDFLDAVEEALRDEGVDAIANPNREEFQKHIARTERPVVLLALPSRSPTSETGFAPVEKVLVDLIIENRDYGLLDETEVQSILEKALTSDRVSYAALKSYAERRKVFDRLPI